MWETEAELIERVITSLRATFPLVPEGEIRNCVAAIHQRFADATVRTYVPVLVDRQARAAIMQHHVRVLRDFGEALEEA